MNKGFGKQDNYPVLVGRGNDRERLLMLAGAGLAVSLLVIGVAALQTLSKKSDPQDSAVPQIIAAPSIGTVTLITPERDVREGASLSDTKFRLVYWPRNNVPDGAIRDESELRGKYAKVSLSSGQPVQNSQISSEAPQRQLLDPFQGNRAVAIEIDETGGIEGWIEPGVRVDVSLTFKEGEGGSGALTSKIIVQNARVLSYGGISDKINAAIDPNIRARRTTARTVTLDVSILDALQLSTASQLGKLRLLLRNLDDIQPLETFERKASDIQKPLNKTERPVKPEDRCSGGIKIGGADFLMCDGKLIPAKPADEN